MSVVSPELIETWVPSRRSGTQYSPIIERGGTAGRPAIVPAPGPIPAHRTGRRRTAADVTSGSQSKPTASLTARELEVIVLVATGATDQQIADALFIARRTVTSHMASILFKLQVGNRTAAAVCAARSGLIW